MKRKKIYFLLVVVLCLLLMKGYVLYTEDPNDDDIPDQLWQFAVLLMPDR